MQALLLSRFNRLVAVVVACGLPLQFLIDILFWFVGNNVKNKDLFRKGPISAIILSVNLPSLDVIVFPDF